MVFAGSGRGLAREAHASKGLVACRADARGAMPDTAGLRIRPVGRATSRAIGDDRIRSSIAVPPMWRTPPRPRAYRPAPQVGRKVVRQLSEGEERGAPRCPPQATAGRQGGCPPRLVDLTGTDAFTAHVRHPRPAQRRSVLVGRTYPRDLRSRADGRSGLPTCRGRRVCDRHPPSVAGRGMGVRI